MQPCNHPCRLQAASTAQAARVHLAGFDTHINVTGNASRQIYLDSDGFTHSTAVSPGAAVQCPLCFSVCCDRCGWDPDHRHTGWAHRVSESLGPLSCHCQEMYAATRCLHSASDHDDAMVLVWLQLHL
jgi:hypothetical protein